MTRAELAKRSGVAERTLARQIVDQVRAAVEAWPKFAAEAEVSDEFATKIGALVK